MPPRPRREPSAQATLWQHLNLDDLPFVPDALPKPPFSGLALVGEAPGADEVRQGRPFVGRSGQLLDRALAECGIDRSHCLVANVFRYRPPDNKIGHFFTSRRRAKDEGLAVAESWGALGSSWCLDAFAPELERLRDTLTGLRPRVVVSLGRTPLWALSGNGEDIGGRRGQPQPCRMGSGITLIATYHPSYALRGVPGAYEAIAADIAQAWRLAQG